jgi:hypothetical protein
MRALRELDTSVLSDFMITVMIVVREFHESFIKFVGELYISI